MVFGLFSKKSTQEKALEKGKKLADRQNYSEALSWYEEVLDKDPAVTEARKGARLCREKLVEKNLHEAECFGQFDVDKAREHALLALTLAGKEDDLKKRATTLLNSIGPSKASKKTVVKEEEEKPKRLFEPSCGGCASPSCGDAHGEEIEENFEDVYYLYLESMPEHEKHLFENLSNVFREGYVALQQGELELAAKRLKEAEKVDAGSPAVAYTRGLLEGLQGQMEAARKYYEKALGAAPDYTSALYAVAATLRELHRPAEAVPLLKSRLEVSPKDREAILLLGASYLDLGNLDEAEETLTELYLSDAKTNSTVAFLWARLKEAQGDPEGAIRAYQIITNTNQNMLEALIPLGLLYISLGEPYAEAAVKVFKHCYRIDQEHGWFHLLRVAEAYAVRGWHKEARKILDEVSHDLPDDPNARALFDQVNKKTQGL